ncbi:hypothetical protein HK100_004330, partial [Physocladia obscura]
MEEDIEDIEWADLPMEEANNDNQTDINEKIEENEAGKEKKNADIKFDKMLDWTNQTASMEIAGFDKTDPKTEPHMNMYSEHKAYDWLHGNGVSADTNSGICHLNGAGDQSG